MSDRTGKRFLIIGAHPDDPDIRFGGTAIKMIRAGHIVKFVSLTNGCCGHHIQSGKELIDRRYAESQTAKDLIGLVEYEVWRDSNDCELEPTVENRKKVIRIIRGRRGDAPVLFRSQRARFPACGKVLRQAAKLAVAFSQFTGRGV